MRGNLKLFTYLHWINGKEINFVFVLLIFIQLKDGKKTKIIIKLVGYVVIIVL